MKNFEGWVLQGNRITIIVVGSRDCSIHPPRSGTTMPLPRWACGLPKESRTASLSLPIPFRSGFVKARKAASKLGSNLTSHRVLDVSGEGAGFAGLGGCERLHVAPTRRKCGHGKSILLVPEFGNESALWNQGTARFPPPTFLPAQRLTFRLRKDGVWRQVVGRRLETRRTLSRRGDDDAVEAFGKGGAEGVDDGAEGAGAGDVIE